MPIAQIVAGIERKLARLPPQESRELKPFFAKVVATYFREWHEAQTFPDFFEGLNPDEPLQPSTLKKLLSKSLYYPCSGLDGTPVKFLGGTIYSFVLADHHVSKDEFLHEFDERRKKFKFKGYQMAFQREVQMNELFPNGYNPIPPDLLVGGNAEQLPPPMAAYEDTWFAQWLILKRDNDRNSTHGPKKFSLLFIRDDATTLFYNLFYVKKCAPKCVAIIQPGSSWTNIRDENQIFAKIVLHNTGGSPDYLLRGRYGGHHEPGHLLVESPWPTSYPERLASWEDGVTVHASRELALFRRWRGRAQ